MNRKLIAGVIVFDEDLNILMLVKSKGSWDLPKGHVEPGEGLLAGAVRECEEETGLLPPYGLEVYPETYIDVYSRSFIRFYMGISPSGFVELSDEHIRYYWLDVDSAIDAFESEGNETFARAVEDMYELAVEKFY